MFFQTTLKEMRTMSEHLYGSRFLLVVLRTSATALGNFYEGGIEECFMLL